MAIEKDPERLENWIGMAADHWRKYQPKRYKRLLKDGTLPQELKKAAQMTADELDRLGAYDQDQMW